MRTANVRFQPESARSCGFRADCRQPGYYTRFGVTDGWAVIRQELENPNAYTAQ